MNSHPVLRFIRNINPPEILELLRREQIIRRAEMYAREGRVDEVWVDGPALRAHVSGSASSPYHCVLRLHGGELEPECSCPYGRGVCWHVGAVLLTLKAEPERLEALERKLTENLSKDPAEAPGRPVAGEGAVSQPARREERTRDMAMLLSGVAKSRLVEALAEWAGGDPNIEARLLDLVPSSADLDVRLFRQAARAALRPGQWLKRNEIPRVAADVREISAALQRSLSGPEPEPVLDLLLEMAWRIWHRAQEADDFDGVLVRAAREVFDQWLAGWEAIPARDRQNLARELFHWLLEDGGGVFRGAIAQAKGALGPLGLETLGTLLRAILESRGGLRGRNEEMQNLDPLASRIREALRETARARGDLGEFLACCDPSGNDGPGILDAGAGLAQEGRFEEALVWVEKGRRRARGSVREGLEELRLSLLIRLGRRREAIESAWELFLAAPGGASFRRLESMAGETDRATWRRRALEQIENTADAAAYVDVCLEAGELERLARGIEKAEGFVLAAPPDLLERTGSALLESWPAAAGRVFSQAAGRILARGDGRHYPEARRHLERARSAFLAAGEEETWFLIRERMAKNHAVAAEWFSQPPPPVDNLPG